MKLPQFDRLPLLIAGTLLLGGACGCSASRSAQATASRPQETRYGATPRRVLPPVADSDAGSTEEYPDFRGPREPGYLNGGRGSDDRNILRPAPAAPTQSPGPELGEPPEFPAADDMTHRAPRPGFRQSLKQKLTGSPRHSPAVASPRGTAQVSSNSAPIAESSSDFGTEQFSGMVTLDVPPELNTSSKKSLFTAPQRQPLPRDRGLTPTPALAARPDFEAAPARDVTQWTPARTPALNQASTPDLPAFPRTSTPESSGTVARTVSKSEPVRVADPPRLSTTPTDGDIEAPSTSSADELAISRMMLCRQVRGFGDVDELHAPYLRQGQPILIYTALDSFLSVATPKGYRTLTSSTLEIQTTSGDVVLRIPLGTAIDQSESPRQDYYLTHKLTIPENLPVGDYVFDLRVEDVQSHEAARARMPVAVRGDRNRPGGTGDTSIFATRPDNFRR